MQKSKRVKQGFFLSMYPAMGIEGVQYWPGERLVGQKRTGLGETSGAEKDWPGRDQWDRKGLAWERPVGQKRTGLGEVSGAGKEAGQHVPRRHNARASTCKAGDTADGVQSLGREGPREKERERSGEMNILSIGE